LHIDANFYHLRTQDSAEVDLLLELESGYIAFEIKIAEKTRPADARYIRNVASILDKSLLHGFVISNDTETITFTSQISAVNAAYFLG
jgi:predicted AAA+ superfamily ATPase